MKSGVCISIKHSISRATRTAEPQPIFFHALSTAGNEKPSAGPLLDHGRLAGSGERNENQHRERCPQAFLQLLGAGQGAMRAAG
jgi:hypothetical protein